MQEVERLGVLVVVESGVLSRETAALQMGISNRQLKRLLRRLREEGPAGLLSRRLGQPSNRRLRAEVRAQVVELAPTRYRDFGPTLLQEKLLADTSLKLSIESVRKTLGEAGLWKAKRRRREIHPPRERRFRFWALIQLDGSPHDWFEGRAERCTLLAFIDDATSRMAAARFETAESTAGYFAVRNEHLLRDGRPISLYSDRHSIFLIHDRKGQKIDGLTQLGRALETMHIEGICAHSPQAKERIERLFQTCQDRLVKEMRLQGINSIAAACLYLSQFMAFFNERFAVAPHASEDAHRPVLKTLRELDLILTEQTMRTLSKNLTIQHRRKFYQVKADLRARRLAGRRITVCDCRDGEVVLLADNEALPYSVGPRKATAVAVVDETLLNRQVAAAVARSTTRPSPAPEHPWTKSYKVPLIPVT